MEIKRYKLQFYGSVQGVGFRYTANHAANMYGLTGYVKNEYDGSVSCEVQGDSDSIEAFIKTLNNGRYIDISHVDKTVIPVIEDERSFDIRY
ncbi:MAG: acylphosphatase [Lachnospiraceae bacterium]|nr:acylphosphatase [Lachnospiraceae bacterium]